MCFVLEFVVEAEGQFEWQDVNTIANKNTVSKCKHNFVTEQKK